MKRIASIVLISMLLMICVWNSSTASSMEHEVMLHSNSYKQFITPKSSESFYLMDGESDSGTYGRVTRTYEVYIPITGVVTLSQTTNGSNQVYLYFIDEYNEIVTADVNYKNSKGVVELVAGLVGPATYTIQVIGTTYSYLPNDYGVLTVSLQSAQKLWSSSSTSQVYDRDTEPNDTRIDASSLMPNKSMCGMLGNHGTYGNEAADTKDVYSFTVKSPQLAIIIVSPVTIGSRHKANVTVKLVGPDKTYVLKEKSSAFSMSGILPKGSYSLEISDLGVRGYEWIFDESSTYYITSNIVAITPTGLILSAKSVVTAVGKTRKLAATPTHSSGYTPPTTIKWYTTNSKIATVSVDGTIKGVGKGKCVISAKTSNGLKASCAVTVK